MQNGIDFDELPRNVQGARRIRRVLERRGDVPPTESLLETLMVQVIRRAGLPDPVRQTNVVIATGWLVARFTWREVTRTPKTCGRRLAALLERRVAAQSL